MADLISKEYLTRQFYNFKKEYIESSSEKKQNKIDFNETLFTYKPAETYITESGASEVTGNDSVGLNFYNSEIGENNDYLISYRNGDKFAFKWQTPVSSQNELNSDNFLINLKCLKDYKGTSNVSTVGNVTSGVWKSEVNTTKNVVVTGKNYSINADTTNLGLLHSTKDSALSINNDGLTINSGDVKLIFNGTSLVNKNGTMTITEGNEQLSINAGNLSFLANSTAFTIAKATFNNTSFDVFGFNVTNTKAKLKATNSIEVSAPTLTLNDIATINIAATGNLSANADNINLTAKKTIANTANIFTVNSTALTTIADTTDFKGKNVTVTADTKFKANSEEIELSGNITTIKATDKLTEEAAELLLKTVNIETDETITKSINLASKSNIYINSSFINFGKNDSNYKATGYTKLIFDNGKLKFNDGQAFIITDDYNAANDNYFSAYKS